MFEYVLVFLGAAIPWLEIALVIPLGILRGLSPVWVMLLAFLGNFITVFLLIVAFERVKAWTDRKRGKENRVVSNRTARGKRLWNKYGLPGLAMLGPFVIGTHIAAFIGLLFGANKINTILWMTISIATWTLVFGITTALGFNFFVVDYKVNG